VLAVEAVLPGNVANVDPAAKKLVQQTLENDRGALDYNLYFSKQMNNANIKLITN
jgi:quinol monooxygenase YgiN